MAAPTWSDAALAQLAGGNVRAAIFLRVDVQPTPLRMWAGIGDFAVAADLVETEDGAIYSGMGELMSLPQVSQLINGLAERVEFKVAGTFIDARIAQMASEEAGLILRAETNLGFLVLDKDQQVMSPMAWLWSGEADSLMIDRDDGAKGQVIRTLTLSVGSVMTGRRRPTPEYWTDPAQKLRSADDRFCENVAGYNIGTIEIWPT